MAKRGFFKGALLGSIIGGIAALLLAPKSGKETQSALKLRARKAAKNAGGRLEEVESELEGRIDNLKVAARELKGEAYDESQQLITRAEILKNDLQGSVSRLSTSSKDLTNEVSTDAKRLMAEGQEVIGELERMTRKIMGSARSKATRKFRNDGDRED